MTSPPPEGVRTSANGLGLRLWHRLLSAGVGDVAEFRGWDRVITWRQHATARDRMTAVRRAIKLPARAAREALADVRKFGDALEEESGVSKPRQAAQLWWLKVRYGLDASSYLDYRLYRPERRRRAGDYLQERDWFRVMRFYLAAYGPESDPRMLTDKRRFERWCGERGFPAVRTVLEVQEGRLHDASGAEVARETVLPLPPRDLFSKPADSTGGHATRRWTYDGSGGYVGADGRTFRGGELLDELVAISNSLPRTIGRMTKRTLTGRLLLQEQLHNHPNLAPVSPGALSTTRLVTYRFPRGEARLLFAAFKMAVGDSPADNFHFGGLVAPVDLATGRLGKPIQRRRKVIVNVERHPDTEALIEGHQLPHWEEAKRLVLQAHNEVKDAPAIGWDVALCEEGPVLVEGNTSSNPDIAQAPSGVPLGATPFVRSLNAHLRERFGL